MGDLALPADTPSDMTDNVQSANAPRNVGDNASALTQSVLDSIVPSVERLTTLEDRMVEDRKLLDDLIKRQATIFTDHHSKVMKETQVQETEEERSDTHSVFMAVMKPLVEMIYMKSCTIKEWHDVRKEDSAEKFHEFGLDLTARVMIDLLNEHHNTKKNEAGAPEAMLKDISDFLMSFPSPENPRAEEARALGNKIRARLRLVGAYLG